MDASVQATRGVRDTTASAAGPGSGEAPTPSVVTEPLADGPRSDERTCTNPTIVQRQSNDRNPIEPTSFAGRLNRLFDTIYPPGRGPLRSSEVRFELESRGQQMSAPYLSQLRSGCRTHPHPNTIGQLAVLFGVRPEYFTGQDPAYTQLMEAELHWLDLAHDPDVREITSALLGLPPEVREDILRAAESGQGPAD